MRMRKLGDILLAQGKVSARDVERTLLAQAEMGDHAEAIRILRETADKDAEYLPEILPELVQNYRQAGELKALREFLESIAAKHPGAGAELPLADWFDVVGVGVRLRAAARPDDWGGSVERPEPVSPTRVLGARFRPAGELVELTDTEARAFGIWPLVLA